MNKGWITVDAITIQTSNGKIISYKITGKSPNGEIIEEIRSAETDSATLDELERLNQMFGSERLRKAINPEIKVKPKLNKPYYRQKERY
jgi:hypothetical protein